MDRNWVYHIFVINRRDTGRAYVTKLILPKDLKEETCKAVFDNIMKTVKK